MQYIKLELSPKNMCITALEADLFDTYVGVWDIDHPTFGYRHVLAYQNSPKNLAHSPNCMLLHVPVKSPLTPSCILDTSHDPNLLEKMANSILPLPRNFARGQDSSRPNFVIEMGIYHIAILNDVSPGAWLELKETIPTHKQPTIREEFIQFYAEEFPSYALVVCCFHNRDTKRASPIMLHYAPKSPDTFHFPTLDSHGYVPKVGAKHRFHQIIVTGSQQLKKPGNGFSAFDLSGVSETLKPFLPKVGAALRLSGTVGPNSDLLLEAPPVRLGGDAEFNFGILKA